MSDPRDKRPLRLLNEVLPDPTPPAEPGNARQRVLASVSRLGALAAAMASMQGGCSGEQSGGTAAGPSVDIPGTSGTGGPVATSSDTGGPAATASKPPPKATATATNAPDIPTGYAVVDPMPPPATCLGVAPTIQATARWKAAGGGALVVEVKLSKPGRSDATYGGSSAVSAWGAKLAGQQVAADSVVLTIEPQSGSTQASIQVPLQCSQGPAHLSIQLDLSGKPAAQGAVPVTLRDTY